MRPLVKICGLTRPQDARLAVELGATHVGVVLAPNSPRRVTPEQARTVFQAAGAMATPVLVFGREAPVTIVHLAEFTGALHVELYGFDEEEAQLVERAGLTVYRVYSVAPEADRLPSFRSEPRPDRPAVLDAGGGGSGRTFRWELLAPQAPHATFIAGGIGPDNVLALLRYTPYGLDLSSGVESTPGVKDPERLRLFFRKLEQQP